MAVEDKVRWSPRRCFRYFLARRSAGLSAGVKNEFLWLFIVGENRTTLRESSRRLWPWSEWEVATASFNTIQVLGVGSDDWWLDCSLCASYMSSCHYHLHHPCSNKNKKSRIVALLYRLTWAGKWPLQECDVVVAVVTIIKKKLELWSHALLFESFDFSRPLEHLLLRNM